MMKPLLAVVALYILWVISEPLRIHARTKYAGRSRAFFWDTLKATPAAISGLITVYFVLTLADRIFTLLGM